MQIIQSYLRCLPTGHGISAGTQAHSPRIEIHHVRRTVHGNGIAIKVWAEIKIAAKEWIYAHELKLNTIQVMQLTPEPKIQNAIGYMVGKTIFYKGQYGNYASIDVYQDDGTQCDAGANCPTDGSIWLDAVILGE